MKWRVSALAKSQQRTYQAYFDREQAKMVMYGAAWCGYCKKARNEFANNGINYIEWDVEKNGSAATRFKQLAGTGYPLIYAGFERLHEFNESKIYRALAQSAEPI